MQLYNSTRQVKAAKIEGAGTGPEMQPELILSNDGGQTAETVTPSPEWMRKHCAAGLDGAESVLGGYFVVYADGYESFCPSEAFERDHQPVDENATEVASGWLAGPTPGQVGDAVRDRAEQAAQEAKWEAQQRQEQAMSIRNNALAFALKAELTAEEVVEVAAKYERFLTGQGRGVQALMDQIAIQSSPGNFDADEYMRGMANGLILALSNFTGEEPQFHAAAPSE